MSETYEDDAGTTEQVPRADRQRVDRPEAPAQSPHPPDDGSRDRDTGGRDAGARDAGGSDAGGSDDDAQRGKRKKSRWPLIILVIIVVLAVIAGVIYWIETAGLESTDDAYTEGNAISVAPKISGYVTQLNINDNTFVKAGQLLFTIDQRDYQTALDQAKANLALAQAQLSGAQVDLDMTRVRAPATLLQAQAQLVQAQANRTEAEREYRRQHAISPQATTQTSIDQANAALASQAAAVNSANAQVQIASLVSQTIQAAEDTVGERQAQLAQAKANLEQAEVNFSYTELRAPQDGWITQRNVDRGTFVQAGQQVFYIVTRQAWIVANFKENQLADMRPGQKVTISVDAYPTLHLTGHVDSIQAGSGARFSAFPAENATGNFVKIVRRVPVKIIIDSGLDDMREVPLGISVEPTVTVR